MNHSLNNYLESNRAPRNSFSNDSFDESTTFSLDSSILSQPDITEMMNDDDLNLIRRKQDLLENSISNFEEEQQQLQRQSSRRKGFFRRASSKSQVHKSHTKDRIVSQERFSRAVQALHVTQGEMEHLLEEAGGLEALKQSLRKQGAITNSLMAQNMHMLVRESSKTGWIRDVDV